MRLDVKLGRCRLTFPPKPYPTYGLNGDLFTVRYMILRTPWVDVLVRNLVRPNLPGSPPHCHGVEMYTLCLKGGYDDTMHTGRKRKVRIGTITHLRRSDYHTADRIYGKSGAWTIGLDCRWKGLDSAGYLIDGEFVSMVKYAEMKGVPQNVVDSIRELTTGEKARRVGAQTDY